MAEISAERNPQPICDSRFVSTTCGRNGRGPALDADPQRLHGMRFGTRRQAKDEVMDWIAFYNHQLLNSTLGYASPMAFEQKWLAGQISLAA